MCGVASRLFSKEAVTYVGIDIVAGLDEEKFTQAITNTSVDYVGSYFRFYECGPESSCFDRSFGY